MHSYRCYIRSHRALYTNLKLEGNAKCEKPNNSDIVSNMTHYNNNNLSSIYLHSFIKSKQMLDKVSEYNSEVYSMKLKATINNRKRENGMSIASCEYYKPLV